MEINNKRITLENIVPVITNIKNNINTIVSNDVKYFPNTEFNIGDIFYYNKKYYTCNNTFSKELDSPDENFELLNLSNILDKQDKQLQKTDKLVGILDFTKGKFDYWFKDSDVNVSGIESVVNYGNGMFKNEDNTCNGIILKDKLYLGESYSNIFDMRTSNSIIQVVQNGDNYEWTWLEDGNSTSISLDFSAIDSNSIHYFTAKIKETTIGITSIDGIAVKDNFVSGKRMNNLMILDRIPVTGDKIIFTECMLVSVPNNFFTSNENNSLPYISKNFSFPEGSLKISFANKNPKDYTFIIEAEEFTSKSPNNLAIPMIFSSTNGNYYKFTVHDTVNYNSFIINKDVAKYIDSNKTINGVYSYDSNYSNNGVINLSINNNSLEHIKYLKRFLIYEGYLSEYQCIQELRKNIYCPNTIKNNMIPDCYGNDNGSYGTYNLTTVDFPMYYDAYYEIISKEGITYSYLSKYGVILGDRKIQDVGGYIRVKDITVPYKLRIIKTDPNQQLEKITSMSYYMKNNFPDTYTTMTEITPDMLPDTSECTDFSNAFYGTCMVENLPYLNTSKGINFSNMYYFTYGYSVKSITYPSIDTSNGEDLSGMYGAYANGNATTLELPQINTSKCKKFNKMYKQRTQVKKVSDIDLSAMTIETINTDNMGEMLYNCKSLTSITFNNVPKGVTIDQLRTATSALETCTIIINYREGE